MLLGNKLRKIEQAVDDAIDLPSLFGEVVHIDQIDGHAEFAHAFAEVDRFGPAAGASTGRVVVLELLVRLTRKPHALVPVRKELKHGLRALFGKRRQNEAAARRREVELAHEYAFQGDQEICTDAVADGTLTSSVVGNVVRQEFAPGRVVTDRLALKEEDQLREDAGNPVDNGLDGKRRTRRPVLFLDMVGFYDGKIGGLHGCFSV